MCEAAGIYTIGYHVDTSELAPNTFLIGEEDIFVRHEQVFQDAIDGKFTSGEIRGGIAEEMVSVTDMGSVVPDDVKAKVNEVYDEMASGNLSPFEGPIYKQDGTIAYEEGYIPSVEEVDGMDFFVDGVVGTDN